MLDIFLLPSQIDLYAACMDGVQRTSRHIKYSRCNFNRKSKSGVVI